MARTWLSVRVELLGGRGTQLWPYPGRVFAVGPSHTFQDLANAINDGFARWDRAHLSMFTLADGRVITDTDSGADMAGSIGGTITAPLDIASVTVAHTLTLGALFQFTFDLGDDWTHQCTIGAEKVDPVGVLGIRPSSPLPYWGWGAIPDQYGRQRDEDTGDSQPPPQRPSDMHPMLVHAWPGREQLPVLDLQVVRAEIASNDAAGFLGAVTGRDVDDALQQIGQGVLMALQQQREQAESVALSVINRLTWRAGVGDDVLAADLLAVLRDQPPGGRLVPVEVDMLITVMETDPNLSTGGYLDLATGQVHDDDATDPMIVGHDAVIDVHTDPQRWLRVECAGSRQGWQDMADFAARQHDTALRDRLEHAIEGGGAFRRFRDVVHHEQLTQQWFTFATDRQLGRARQFLADHGIRVA